MVKLLLFLAVFGVALGLMASRLHQDCPYGSVSIGGVAMCRSGQ